MKLDINMFGNNNDDTDYDIATLYTTLKYMQIVQSHLADANAVFNSVSIGDCLSNAGEATQAINTAKKCLSGNSGVESSLHTLITHTSNIINTIILFDENAAALFKYLDEQFGWDDFGELLASNGAKTVLKEFTNYIGNAIEFPGSSVVLAFVGELFGGTAKSGIEGKLADGFAKVLFGAGWAAGKAGYDLAAAKLEEYFEQLTFDQINSGLMMNIPEAELLEAGAAQLLDAAAILRKFWGTYLGATAIDYVGSSLVSIATDLTKGKSLGEAFKETHWGQQALRSTIKTLCSTVGAMIWPFAGKQTGSVVGAVIAEWAINNLNATDHISADGWCGIGAGGVIIGAGVGSYAAAAAGLVSAGPVGWFILIGGAAGLIIVELINDGVTAAEDREHLEALAEEMGLTYDEVRAIRDKEEERLIAKREADREAALRHYYSGEELHDFFTEEVMYPDGNLTHGASYYVQVTYYDAEGKHVENAVLHFLGNERSFTSNSFSLTRADGSKIPNMLLFDPDDCFAELDNFITIIDTENNGGDATLEGLAELNN